MYLAPKDSLTSVINSYIIYRILTIAGHSLSHSLEIEGLGLLSLTILIIVTIYPISIIFPHV